jgi:hypothetical protein
MKERQRRGVSHYLSRNPRPLSTMAVVVGIREPMTLAVMGMVVIIVSFRTGIVMVMIMTRTLWWQICIWEGF